MRDYGKVSPRFWTGKTGKAIRAIGPEAIVVALYLMTAPGSSMIGIYYLPMPTLSHETGLSTEGASKALRSLRELDFAHYDTAAELVWVPEMAKHQIGEALIAKDKRHIGVVRELYQYRKHRFYRDFYERYETSYNLPQPSPLEAPSEALRSQDQDQEQEQEHDLISDNSVGDAAAAKPSRTRKVAGATELPSDLVLSQKWIDWAADDEHVQLDAKRVAFEFDQFCDHARKNGRKAKDWNAALRSWLRNARKFDPGAPKPPPKTERHGKAPKLGPDVELERRGAEIAGERDPKKVAVEYLKRIGT